MSLKEIQVLARRQVDAVEVVRLVNLKNIGRVIVVLVYCSYRLKHNFSWNTLFKLGYHFLGRFLKTQNELFF